LSQYEAQSLQIKRYAVAFLAFFSAFFSAGVFNGFFFAFFLLSIPLLMIASLKPMDWVAHLFTAKFRKHARDVG
jgi:hypothetical protein